MIHLPEPQHQALASSERQVTVLGPIADSQLLVSKSGKAVVQLPTLIAAI